MAETSLKYGDITLQVVKTNSISRVPVRTPDGSAYMYTQWVFDVIAHYNPGDVGMAYSTVANAPVVTVGAMAPTTDNAIRDYLQTDRRTLTFTAEGVEVLKSPAEGYVVDAKSGPQCKVHTIAYLPGMRTWVIHLQFETFVRNCLSPANPLIAHNWRVVVDVDAESMTTRTITGAAFFNVGELVKQGQYPDEYRKDLLHVCPPDMYRDSVNVQNSEDGSAITYTIVDRQRVVNLGKTSPASRLEATESAWVQTMGFVQALAEHGSSIASGVAKAAIASRMSRRRSGELLNTAAGEILSGIGNLFTSTIPKIRRTINVRAYGPMEVLRKNLLDLALGVAFGRLGIPSQTVSVSLLVTQDLIDKKFIEVNYQICTGLEQVYIGRSFNSTISIINSVIELFPQDMQGEIIRIVKDTTQAAFIEAATIPQATMTGQISQRTFGNRPLSNSNGTRGSWVGKLVAQVLAYPANGDTICTQPPKPPPGDATTTDRSLQ